ncbi:MAG: hypothetical protein WC725_02145 [Patescibacteria group bacterium]|jgi:hypothetical protein
MKIQIKKVNKILYFAIITAASTSLIAITAASAQTGNGGMMGGRGFRGNFQNTTNVNVGTQGGWSPSSTMMRGGFKRQPGVFGTITAINGTNITISDNRSGPTGTIATFNIDSSAATFVKIVAPTSSTPPTQTSITISDLAVGNTISVKGTVNGATVTATEIYLREGNFPGIGMMRGRFEDNDTVSSTAGKLRWENQNGNSTSTFRRHQFDTSTPPFMNFNSNSEFHINMWGRMMNAMGNFFGRFFR